MHFVLRTYVNCQFLANTKRMRCFSIENFYRYSRDSAYHVEHNAQTISIPGTFNFITEEQTKLLLDRSRNYFMTQHATERQSAQISCISVFAIICAACNLKENSRNHRSIHKVTVT